MVTNETLFPPEMDEMTQTLISQIEWFTLLKCRTTGLYIYIYIYIYIYSFSDIKSAALTVKDAVDGVRKT